MTPTTPSLETPNLNPGIEAPSVPSVGVRLLTGNITSSAKTTPEKKSSTKSKSGTDTGTTLAGANGDDQNADLKGN